MKKHSPIYTNDCIIYWPSFVGGLGFVCFSSMTLLLLLFCCIIFLLDRNTDSKATLIIAIVATVYLICLVLFSKTIVKSMFCCITITKRNFSISNEVMAIHTNILWEQVLRIEFHQEGYRGRKQFRVFLKQDCQTQYIAIPIIMVNEEKLYDFIPSELLSNKPHSV